MARPEASISSGARLAPSRVMPHRSRASAAVTVATGYLAGSSIRSAGGPDDTRSTVLSGPSCSNCSRNDEFSKSPPLSVLPCTAMCPVWVLRRSSASARIRQPRLDRRLEKTLC
jgi:hypothetical protein